jgi:flagellar L-ring protein FlgH
MRICLVFCVAALLPPVFAKADSLFNQQVAKTGTPVTQRVARFDPGDIITVLVEEEISASTSSNTDTKKESDVESEAASGENPFLITDSRGGSSGMNIINEDELPNWAIEAENEHKTAGTTGRSTTLETVIPCFVTKIMPNGNIMLEGDKTVTVNREDSTMHISGMVRARDVSPDNTVSSKKMALATVQLKGKGPLWNNQRRGIVTKILDWFSPF